MALGATIYVFKIDLADSDRGVYQPLELRVARHPSESEEYLLCRVLAYCLNIPRASFFERPVRTRSADHRGARLDRHAEGVDRRRRAGSGAAAPGGQAGAARRSLHAQGRRPSWPRGSQRNAFIASRRWNSMPWIAHWLATLAARLARRMEFSLTVADRHVYLSLGEETLSSWSSGFAVGADRGRN